GVLSPLLTGKTEGEGEETGARGGPAVGAPPRSKRGPPPKCLSGGWVGLQRGPAGKMPIRVTVMRGGVRVVRITRRRFLAGLGAAAVGCGAYSYGIEPHRVTVVRRDLPIANLPPDLDGKRLVQISDLHLGPVGADYLTDCFRRVEKLRPELIVITGDYMTSRAGEEVENVGRLLQQLKTAPLGAYGTPANH